MMAKRADKRKPGTIKAQSLQDLRQKGTKLVHPPLILLARDGRSVRPWFGASPCITNDCRSGGESQAAMNELVEFTFESVRDVKDLQEWSRWQDLAHFLGLFPLPVLEEFAFSEVGDTGELREWLFLYMDLRELLDS